MCMDNSTFKYNNYKSMNKSIQIYPKIEYCTENTLKIKKNPNDFSINFFLSNPLQDNLI